MLAPVILILLGIFLWIIASRTQEYFPDGFVFTLGFLSLGFTISGLIVGLARLSGCAHLL